MQRQLTGLMTDHPNSVGETYFQHFMFALGFSLRLFAAAAAALVHAFLPFLFEKTASNAIKEMHHRIHNR